MTLPGGEVQDSQPLCLSSKILSRWHPDFLLFYRPWLDPKLEKTQQACFIQITVKVIKDLCYHTHTHKIKQPVHLSLKVCPYRRNEYFEKVRGKQRKQIHCNYEILLWKVVFSQTAPISGKTGLQEFKIFHLKSSEPKQKSTVLQGWEEKP